MDKTEPLPLTEYIESWRRELAGKPAPESTNEDWLNRIIQGHDYPLNALGAVAYLHDYGQGLTAYGAAWLAMTAERAGLPGFAQPLWIRSYRETFQRMPPPEERMVFTESAIAAARLSAEGRPAVALGSAYVQRAETVVQAAMNEQPEPSSPEAEERAAQAAQDNL